MDVHLGLSLSSSYPLHTPMAVMFSKMKKNTHQYTSKERQLNVVHI